MSTHPAPRRAVRSWCGAASCTVEVRGRRIGSVFQLAGAYASRCSGSAMTDRSVATSGEPRPGRSCGALPVRSGSAKTSTWPNVRTCQTCQRTKAAHGGPRGLIHPLPLPTRRGGMIGVDWIAGLPTTAAGFDMIQNHVDLLSSKVHAVPTRATATVEDAAEIICDMSPLQGRVPRHARRGSRRQAHESGFPGFCEEHGLDPHRLLGEPQEYQRQGATGQRCSRLSATRCERMPTAARTIGTSS